MNKIQVCLLFLLACSAPAPKAQIITLSGQQVPAAVFDDFLRKQMDELGMPGLVIAVINSDSIVYHRAFGVGDVDKKTKVDEESIFEAASMSKPVFAYLVMKMVDKGLLNLDTPLYRYMPYTDIETDSRYRLITARMVLTHRTGFPNWRYFNRADDSLHVKYPDLYLKFTPGTQYGYSGEGFLYLAKVIAHLTGRTLQTLEPLYEEQVAVPLQMAHAWFTGNSYINQHKVSGHIDGHVQVNNGTTWPIAFPDWDSSYFNPAASLYTDLLSYTHFVINWMAGKGLSRSSFTEMLRPQYELPSGSGEFGEPSQTGLGVFITEAPYGIRYQHGGSNGNFQSDFVWYPSLKSGYVYFTNCNKQQPFERRLREFFTNGK